MATDPNVQDFLENSETYRLLQMGNPDPAPGLELPDQDVGLFNMEREVRDSLEMLASNSSDPDGALQNFDTAMIYSSYFGMDMDKARKMAELGVASSVTGIDYEGKNYGQALKTTGQHALWQEGKGLATSAYQFTGDPKFLRIAEDYDNKIRNNPVTKEYGAIGDLVLDSVQPAMSTLKFLGTTALLSWIPGGIAAKTGWKTLSTLTKAGTSVARGVNFLSAGYSQAGNVLYEVMNTEDANGNKLPWDTVSGGLLFHGFAMLTGAVEMASFERLPFFKAIDKAFTRGELVKHLERGAVNAIKNYSFETGKSTVSEALEEGAQSILQNVYQNILMEAANKDGADFDTASVTEIAKEAVDSTIEAGKTMILTSLISGGIGQGVYTAQHRKLSANAEKNFKKTKDSVSVPSEFVRVSPDVFDELKSENEQASQESGETTEEQTRTELEKLDPVRGVNVGEAFIPINVEEAKKAAEAHSRGASAMNIIVEEMREVDASDRQALVNQAAIASGGKISEDGEIVYESVEDAKMAVYILQDSVESVNRGDGSYQVILRGLDGELNQINLRVAGEEDVLTDPDFAYADDVNVPHSLSRMAQDRAEEYAERELVKDKLGQMVEHTGGRIAKTDLEANVDAVILVANTLHIPTDELLEKNVLISFEEFVKNDKGNDTTARGSITQTGERQYTIHISKSADVSTMIHELGHTLRGLASQEQLADFKQHYGIDGLEAGFLDDIVFEGEKYKVGGREFDTEAEAKQYATAVEERFADDFVAYLMTGQAPTAELKNIFGRMKDVLTKLFREFKDRLTPEVRQAFDQLISGQYPQISNAIPGLPNEGDVPLDADGNVLFQTESEKRRIKEYLDGAPIVSIGLDEVPFLGNIGAIATWADEWFKKIGVKNIHRPDIGDIELTRRSVKDSLSHGMTVGKVQGLKTLPEVIKNGQLVYSGEKGSHTGYVIASPVRIGPEDYIELVLLRKSGDDSSKLYVHEVILKEKALSASKPIEAQEPDGHQGLLKSLLQDIYSVNSDESLFQLAPDYSSSEYHRLESEASDAVKENGILRRFFHGSENLIEDFSPEYLGTNTGAKDAFEGFFFTSDRDTAEGYASTAIPTKRIEEIENEMERLQDLAWEAYDRDEDDLGEEYEIKAGKLQVQLNKIETSRATGDFEQEGAVTEVVIPLKNPMVIEYEGEEKESFSEFISQAKEEGNDGLIVRNVLDGPWGGDVSDVVVVFDASDIYTVEQTLFQQAPPTDSEAFKNWFGDSKVIDENGVPRVVYHSTNKDFTSFLPKGKSEGIWFGVSKYVDMNANSTGGRTIPVYLSVNNPKQIEVGDVSYRAENKQIRQAKKEGYDGIEWTINGEPLSFTVFESTQIKSVNNRGTWDPNNQNILYQKVRKDVREGTLAVLHNITSENLENIDRIGGMPSPSIAITKPDIPFTQFGEITLIADPSVAEKAMEEARLYDRDIWSPTVPKAEWKISQKIIDAFDSKIRAVGDEIGTWIGGAETFSSSVIKDGLNSLVYAYSRNLGAQIAFLKENGIVFKVKYKKQNPDNSLPIEIIDENLEYFRSHDLTIESYDEIVGYLKPKIEEYLNTAYAKYRKKNPAAFKSITDNMRERYTSFGDIDRTFRFVKSYKKGDTVFDEYGTKDALSPIIKEHSSEFDLWLKKNLAPAYSDPKLKIGSKKYAYTAENILKWMRSQSQKASQSSMTYGPSKAASNAGTVLSDRQSVRDKESILVTSEESKSAWEQNIEPITEELQARLPEYSDDDTWDALDSIYKSIGRYISKYGSEWNPSLMRKQFSNNGFKGVPTELIEKSLELVEALALLPQDYFEAKPNRVVGLNEFVLAVVPKTLQDDKRDILRKYGIEVIDYDGITDDRANVVKELFKGKAPNILFQGEGIGGGAKNKNLLFQLSPKARKELADRRHDDVEQAVAEMFYVPTQILQEYAGEAWADKELELRRHLAKFPWILEEARRHSDEESFFDYLRNEHPDMSEYEWSVEDELWYARIFAYSRIMTPSDRDKQFVRMHTATDRDLIELGQMLKGYRDVGVKNNKGRKGYSEYVQYNWGSFKGVSTKVKTLSPSSSKEEIQEARRLIEANPRPYRKALNIVLEAEDRVQSMKAGDQYGHSQYARDNYFDTLGEEIEEELKGSNIGEMTDREVAKFYRETENREERAEARDRLATKSGVLAMERQLEKELKDLGIENEKNADRLKKDLRNVKKSNIALQKQLESARDDYRSALAAYREEADKSKKLGRTLDREAGKAATKLKNLKKALDARRERVATLRSELTEKNRLVKSLESKIETLKRRADNRKTMDELQRLHDFLRKRVKFNADVIDASFQEAMDKVYDLLDENQKQGGYEILPEKLRAYLNEEALGYVQRGRNIGQWTKEELLKLIDAVELMRMDGKLMLEQKKLMRSSRLQSLAMSYYRQTYGEDANVTVGYSSIVPQILQELGEKRSRYSESGWDAVKRTVQGAIIHSQRLARLIDGDRQDGVMTNLLVRKVYEQMSAETENTLRRLEPAEKKMKELGLTSAALSKDFFTYKTMSGDEIHLTLGQTIGLYVYSQNQISSEKLQNASGNGINFTQLADAISTLTENQKAWGDYMIDELGGDETWERMAKVYYEVYNKNLGRRDRYFTFVADGVEDEGMMDTINGAMRDSLRWVDKGMTKEVDIYATYPLKLDVTSTFMTQVKRQEHFIEWAAWLRDMNYLFERGGMGKMIDMNYGPKIKKQVLNFIKDIGSPQTILEDIERLGNKILSNASVAMLSLNALTMLKQLPSFASAFRDEVDMRDFLKASTDLSNPGKHRELMEFIYEKSPLMKKRQISIELAQYENEVFSNPIWRASKKFNDKIGMKGIQMMDHIVVSTLWLARYNTFIRNNQDTYQTQSQLEDEAAFQATNFIQETQPSSLVSDTSSLQKNRSPWVRAFLMFSNQIFQYMNMALFDIPAAWRTRDIKHMMGLVANLAISGGLIILTTGAFFRGDGEDDEEWLKRILKEVSKMAVTYTVPFVGNEIASGIDGWSSGSGLIQLPVNFGRLLGETIDGDWDKVVDRAWDVGGDLGTLSGMPSVFVNRAVKSVREDNLFYILNKTYGELWEDRK